MIRKSRTLDIQYTSFFAECFDYFSVPHPVIILSNTEIKEILFKTSSEFWENFKIYLYHWIKTIVLKQWMNKSLPLLCYWKFHNIQKTVNTSNPSKSVFQNGISYVWLIDFHSSARHFDWFYSIRTFYFFVHIVDCFSVGITKKLISHIYIAATVQLWKLCKWLANLFWINEYWQRSKQKTKQSIIT